MGADKVKGLWLNRMSGAYTAWTCPFCNAPATQPTAAKAACESRTCACGAIGLAGPACDVDAIMEDAVGIFGSAVREDTRVNDSMLRHDVRLGEVEIRHGQKVPVKRGLLSKPLDWTSLWFRR
jgi:transcription elongation factor Elf1